MGIFDIRELARRPYFCREAVQKREKAKAKSKNKAKKQIGDERKYLKGSTS
jgi:hypothetical protein